MPAGEEKQRETPCVPLESASLPRLRRTLGLVCLESVTEEEFGQGRIVLDRVLGIILPSLTIAIVSFLGGPWSGVMSDLNLYQFVVHASGLLIWLALSAGSRIRFAPLFAGWLFIGAFDALRVGAHVLPWILPALFFYGAGALGIVPFVAAWVMARNAVSAFNRVGSANARTTAKVALASLLAFAVPYALNWAIHNRAGIDVISFMHEHWGNLVQWVWEQ